MNILQSGMPRKTLYLITRKKLIRINIQVDKQQFKIITNINTNTKIAAAGPCSSAQTCGCRSLSTP